MTQDSSTLGPPLAGIRVLDFSHILAGPFCTRLLSDLGADVAKVESSRRQERMGAVKLTPDYKGRTDRTPSFLNTNRSKRSISIDLKSPGGLELTRKLATVADVLVENFSATVMDRLGLGYADLQPLNPRLVYVSMAGYGHSGPRRDWTSMNSNLQAYSGLMMVTGKEGEPPVSISNSWNDYMGGLHACFGIMQALAERAVSGKGANLDLAQFECSVATLGGLLMASAVNKTAPARTGNRSDHAAPQGCYRCAGQDEWCVISVQSDDQWHRLVAALSDVPQLRDERFATLLGRLKHHDHIDGLIEGWTSQVPNTEVEARLKAAGVPAERMRRI
ncbi:MAG TPA: CoA transferase, partial [Chloroflexota bacterium]|nr:CoA transferase [Chloroflexota bacterium]